MRGACAALARPPAVRAGPAAGGWRAIAGGGRRRGAGGTDQMRFFGEFRDRPGLFAASMRCGHVLLKAELPEPTRIGTGASGTSPWQLAMEAGHGTKVEKNTEVKSERRDIAAE